MKFFKIIILFFIVTTFVYAEDEKNLDIYDRPDIYWLQLSNEYENVTKTLYLFAKIKLDENIKTKKLSAFIEQKEKFKDLPSAVIMDIDETILNNSAYAVYQQMELNGLYSEQKWDSFVKKGISTQVVGSVDFINYAVSKGVKVFLVSNRSQDQKNATVNNLKKIGVKIPDLKNQVMLVGGKSNWDSNKFVRYREIAKNYYIAMIVGDNMTDFLPKFDHNLSYKKYKKLNKQYKDYISKYWIQLPAPTYGSWQEIEDIEKELKTFKGK